MATFRLPWRHCVPVGSALVLLSVLACSSGTRPSGDVLDGSDRPDVGEADGNGEAADAGESGDEVDARPCGPDMAMIETLGVCIDRYEASRAPDGSAASVLRVLPWASLAWGEASEACRLAGKRLCTFEEWNAACAGPEVQRRPAQMESEVSADEYLWLEEVAGERAMAWVAERNAESVAALESDAGFAPLKARLLAWLVLAYVRR